MIVIDEYNCDTIKKYGIQKQLRPFVEQYYYLVADALPSLEMFFLSFEILIQVLSDEIECCLEDESYERAENLKLIIEIIDYQKNKWLNFP